MLQHATSGTNSELGIGCTFHTLHPQHTAPVKRWRQQWHVSSSTSSDAARILRIAACREDYCNCAFCSPPLSRQIQLFAALVPLSQCPPNPPANPSSCQAAPPKQARAAVCTRVNSATVAKSQSNFPPKMRQGQISNHAHRREEWTRGSDRDQMSRTSGVEGEGMNCTGCWRNQEIQGVGHATQQWRGERQHAVECMRAVRAERPRLTIEGSQGDSGFF